MTALVRAIVPTTPDREAMLGAFLRSFDKYGGNTILTVIAQGMDKAQEDRTRFAVSLIPNAETIFLPNRVGPHTAKRYVLRKRRADVWLSLDDDMELLPDTNYSPAIARVQELGFGFVSCGWVRSEAALLRGIRNVQNTFVNQPIVYTGGGMLFSDKTADLVRALPDVSYVCDNSVWSLAAYTAGLVNQRYRGSLCIHRVVSKGGRKAFLTDTRAVQGMKDLITYEPSSIKPYPFAESNVNIPSSAGLTDKAKKLHADNRRKLMGLS